MTALRILAGPAAYQHIRERGLTPGDISAVFGASGAAKWITIYGLDKAVFSEWLSDSEQPIDLFGTSVGAFKLAAAAQRDPATALTRLVDAYIDQNYEDKDTAAQITVEIQKILDAFLPQAAIAEVLSSPRFNFHCASIYCKGWLATEDTTRQKLVMFKAFLLSLLGNRFQRGLFERCIFHSGQSANNLSGNDDFPTIQVPLSPENFRQALLSSGSIPVVMPAIMDIPGAPAGTYRDGGLLDYHPVPSSVGKFETGLVLYPHFYRYVKEGWFDKFWPWRKARPEQLDNTVILAPSHMFVASLPGGRIPDRQDFYHYENNDKERVRRWTEVKERSLELGEEFLQLSRSGRIADRVEPLVG